MPIVGVLFGLCDGRISGLNSPSCEELGVIGSVVEDVVSKVGGDEAVGGLEPGLDAWVFVKDLGIDLAADERFGQFVLRFR